jgi:phytoene dehydrogenase-like protein
VAGKIPWKNPAAAGAGTVHLGADLDGLTRYAAHLATGEVPPHPFLLLGQMTTADPAHSPEGTESAWAYTHLPHRARWSDHEIAAHVERMEAVLEEYAPGFGDLVVGRNVFSPAGLERENPSLVGGALGGGTAAAAQQLFLRPVPGLGRADTPIERLYLASASAHPGGGVHGAPGANAARAALARERALTGGLYRAAINAAHRAIYHDGAP